MKRLIAAVAVVMVASGCSDPVAPCSDCIDGYDLEIAEVRVSPGTARDPDGLAVAGPGQVALEVLLRNNGTEAAPPVSLLVNLTGTGAQELAVPAIPPGDSLVLPATLLHSRKIFMGNTTDRMDAHARLVVEGDADDSNHALSTAFHYAVPILDVVVHSIANPKPRVNEPFRLSMTVTNRSAHAASTPVSFRFCLWDIDYGCSPGDWAAFGGITEPALAPLATRTESVTTAINPDAMVLNYGYSRTLRACTIRPGWTDPYIDFGYASCFTAPGVYQVKLDFDGSCAIPNATSGGPVVFTTHNCGILPTPTQLAPRDDTFRRYHAVSLDAVAGRTYYLSGVAQVFNSDGDQMYNIGVADGGIVLPVSGRYFLVSQRTTPHQTMQVSLTR